ncbi:MAG TPA: hypothetical protein VFN74_15210, partial [Chloroflexota bacterium]|nr:hypothetical protein [Chloroflexota bacterium]
HGALAAGTPIASYRVYTGEHLLATLPFRPQTTLDPLEATLPAPAWDQSGPIRVVAAMEDAA